MVDVKVEVKNRLVVLDIGVSLLARYLDGISVASLLMQGAHF